MEAFNNLTQYLSEYSKGIKMKMLLNSVRPAKISCTGENISRIMTQKFKKKVQPRLYFCIDVLEIDQLNTYDCYNCEMVLTSSLTFGYMAADSKSMYFCYFF